jgi:rSAM/selenodomain-associated transferase 1
MGATGMPEAVVCIFAKPPQPDLVKTRLIPAFGAERAAELAEAFLEDTVALVRALPWAECIIAATERFERSYFRPEEIWLQSEGDLGARLEKILRLALKRRAVVLAIGADSPGLPVAFLENARNALRGSDTVLGPSADGGFYLIGLKECPVGVLDGIQWSHSSTLAETATRLEQYGLKTSRIGEWFDVDTPEDLERLRRHLEQYPLAAPKTAALLRRIFRLDQHVPDQP